VGEKVKTNESLDVSTKYDEELRRKDLKVAVNLENDFKAWEDYILAHQSVDVFDELFKIIYAKLTDEYINLKDDQSICQFRAGLEESENIVFSRIQNLLREGISRWGIIQMQDEIKLLPNVLKNIVLQMQKYYLLKTPKDVIGTAFEYLVTRIRKGEKGQYFTPLTVVEMMVEMSGISWDKKVLDPACGSGSFLVYTLEKVWKEIDTKIQDPRLISREQSDYANLRVFGIDYDPKIVQIAQVNMLMLGDSRTNIFCEDSLKDYTWSSVTKRFIQRESFDVILTNPPFAGDIKDPNVLRNFILAHKDGKLLRKQGRHILFLEMCLNYLRPGGILAIVLPKGIFNNPTLKYVRNFIKERAQILACISLDPYVFAPHTGNRTGVIVLKKKEKHAVNSEPYEIFMAISHKSGKKQGGRPIYRTDSEGRLIYDELGRPIPDSDLKAIAEAYLTRVIPPQLTEQCFWVKSSELEDRIDPEYYAPVRKISNLQKMPPLKPLKEYAQYVKRTINPTKSPSQIFRYIELDDINELGMIVQTKEILGKNAPSRARLLVREGDIITAMSGSKTGSLTHHRCAIITKEYDGCVVSTGFGVLIPKKGVDLYFLYGLLRSPYVLNEMHRKLQGGGIPKISEKDLLEILVPDIPPEIQKQISENIKLAMQQLEKARSYFVECRNILEKYLSSGGL
jgi:type I restriction enzyme M protein